LPSVIGLAWGRRPARDWPAGWQLRKILHACLGYTSGFARLIVVLADQAPTSSLEQPENAPGSKSSSTTAFFDSIGQPQKSGCVSGKSALPSILLQKSFCGGEQKFLELLVRFTRGDVRDHIASSIIDHGSS
jgi:hypothetical protein